MEHTCSTFLDDNCLETDIVKGNIRLEYDMKQQWNICMKLYLTNVLCCASGDFILDK